MSNKNQRNRQRAFVKEIISSKIIWLNSFPVRFKECEFKKQMMGEFLSVSSVNMQHGKTEARKRLEECMLTGRSIKYIIMDEYRSMKPHEYEAHKCTGII